MYTNFKKIKNMYTCSKWNNFKFFFREFDTHEIEIYIQKKYLGFYKFYFKNKTLPTLYFSGYGYSKFPKIKEIGFKGKGCDILKS